MKVKLLKELPGFTVGQILTEKDYPIDLKYTDFFEVVKEGRWRAEQGERYFYIASGGDNGCVIDSYDTYDNFRYRTNNYFRNKEDKQKALDKINAIADLTEIIERENGDWIPDYSDFNERKWYIYLNVHINTYYTGCLYNNYTPGVLPYAKSESTIEMIIKEYPHLLDKIFK